MNNRSRRYFLRMMFPSYAHERPTPRSRKKIASSSSSRTPPLKCTKPNNNTLIMSSSHQHHHINNPSHSNVHFESYYRHQLFSNGDDEKAFQSLLQTLSKPLPLTFRITKNAQTECTINALKRIIESEQQQQQRVHFRTISFLNDPRTFQIDNIGVNNDNGGNDDLKTKHPNFASVFSARKRRRFEPARTRLDDSGETVRRKTESLSPGLVRISRFENVPNIRSYAE